MVVQLLIFIHIRKKIKVMRIESRKNLTQRDSVNHVKI